MSRPLPIRNPFEHRVRRAAFEAAVRCYIARHRDLFRPDGGRANGSAPSVWFWRGYDGVASNRWQDDARQMSAYAFYRAGQAVAAGIAKGLIPEQPCAPSPNTPASAAAAPAATG